MPLILGLLSAAGLTTALLADGLADAISWIALGIPLLVSALYARPRS